MKTLTAVPVAFDDVGEDEAALLMLPGWCSNRTAFRPLLAPAGRHRRVLALDWRGHGGSERPRGDFGTAELVDDAVGVLDVAGVERVVPVALSHAGWVAIELWRRLGGKRRPRSAGAAASPPGPTDEKRPCSLRPFYVRWWRRYPMAGALPPATRRADQPEDRCDPASWCTPTSARVPRLRCDDLPHLPHLPPAAN